MIRFLLKTAALFLGAVTAFGLCAFGLVAGYNFWVAQEDRVGGHRLDAIMFFGPSIVSVGLLLLWALLLAIRTRLFANVSALARRLTLAGVAIALLPAVAAWALDVLSKGEGRFNFLIALYLFTGPGICLVIFGLILGFSCFCPSCGKVLRPGECRKQRQHGPLYELLCPDCGSRVLLSGVPTLVLGLVILVVSVMFIGIGGEGLPLLGFVVAALGLGLCLIALMRARLVRRLTCGNRHDPTFW
jgi:hypothetical protein